MKCSKTPICTWWHWRMRTGEWLKIIQKIMCKFWVLPVTIARVTSQQLPISDPDCCCYICRKGVVVFRFACVSKTAADRRQIFAGKSLYNMHPFTLPGCGWSGSMLCSNSVRFPGFPNRMLSHIFMPSRVAFSCKLSPSTPSTNVGSQSEMCISEWCMAPARDASRGLCIRAGPWTPKAIWHNTWPTLC